MQAWQATVQNEQGNVVFNPSVTVYLEDGVTLATIFNEDESPKANPFIGSLDGFVQFWADNGVYKIVGANGSDSTEVWEVQLGSDKWVYENYSDFIGSYIPNRVVTASAVVSGTKISWARDPAGPIGPTADGGMWSPADAYFMPQHFGAMVDGATDDTAALQSALDAARQSHKSVLIPGGSIAISDVVTFDLTGGTVETDEAEPSIIGEGAGITEIRMLNDAAQLRIVGDNTVGAGAHHHNAIRGIKFNPFSATAVPALYLEKCAFMMFDNLFFIGGGTAIDLHDCLSLRFMDVQARFGQRGVQAFASTGYSNPNSLSFYGCHFAQQGEYAARFTNPAQVNFFGGSIEGCGKTGESGFEGGIRIDGNPGIAGGIGLFCQGVYFEGNKGSADIVIINGNRNVAHTIVGNNFNRINSTDFTTRNILMDHLGVTTKSKLFVSGNAFNAFNTYVEDVSRPYVQIIDPNNRAVFVDGGNLYGADVAWPVAGGQLVAAAKFNGTPAAPVVDGDVNIASITKNATGDYTLTFKQSVPTGNRRVQISLNGQGVGFVFGETATTVRIRTADLAGALTDFSAISVDVVR